MKYIIDIDALKKCVELYVTSMDADGNDVIKVEVIKRLLDAFPKDEVVDEKVVPAGTGVKYRDYKDYRDMRRQP